MEKFIQSIKQNLETNDFPAKRVGLPTEKMYEIADDKGLSLNEALERMRDEDGIQFEIGPERIVFSKVEVSEETFPNINPDMLGKVQEMMSQMDPKELQEIQEKVAGMSEEDRAKMMEQARGMGLF